MSALVLCLLLASQAGSSGLPADSTALAALEAGRFEEAARLLRASASLGYEELVALGVAEARLGNREAAAAAFGNAIAQDLTPTEALLERGGLYFLDGRYEDARRDLQASLALREDAHARDLLAASLHLLGRTDEAIAAWNRLGGPTVSSDRDLRPRAHEGPGGAARARAARGRAPRPRGPAREPPAARRDRRLRAGDGAHAPTWRWHRRPRGGPARAPRPGLEPGRAGRGHARPARRPQARAALLERRRHRNVLRWLLAFRRGETGDRTRPGRAAPVRPRRQPAARGSARPPAVPVRSAHREDEPRPRPGPSPSPGRGDGGGGGRELIGIAISQRPARKRRRASSWAPTSASSAASSKAARFAWTRGFV